MMDDEAYAAVKVNDHRSLQKRLRDAEGLVPVNVSARNGAGLTMLHVACYQGGYDCARVLLEKARADVHSLGNECKSTPLQFAAFSGNVDLVKLLLKYQGKVNHQNAAGKTALHFASAGGHVEIIRLLLLSGASRRLHDEQGRTPHDYAEEKGQREAAAALITADGEKGQQQLIDDTDHVRLTFEKLDPAAVKAKAELDRRYEQRRLAEKEKKENLKLRPPRSAESVSEGDGSRWVPIVEDGFFQGKVPRLLKVDKVDKGVGKKEEFVGAVRGGGVGDVKNYKRDRDDTPPKPGGGGDGNAILPQKGDSPAGNMEFLEKELTAIVGMDNVKKMLRSLCKKVSVDQQRMKFGFQNDQNLNMIFLGAPGTGKTSMARVVAKLLRHLGVLEKGHLVEVCRKDLVAEYSGQSAVKTAAKVQEALGGVLFIDEAYSLKHEGSKDSFGQEAVDTLVAEMEVNRKRLVVIIAGYTKEMADFMRSNSGLGSRFPHTFEFVNYTPNEMAQIFKGMASARKLQVQLDDSRLSEVISQVLPKSEAAKGNARAVRNLLEKVLSRQTDRVADKGTCSMESLLTLIESDFTDPVDISHGGDVGGGAGGSFGSSIDGVLKELEEIVGIAEVKHLFHTLRAKVTIAVERRALGLPAHGASSLHMLFQGNPGTGKTTVARLMGRLFKAVNILPRGHLVEVSRVDLVGQHVGETAGKTRNIVENATGGVLFVDEAYTLVSDSKDSFGKEALESVMKCMEDMREELVVILAGYPREMNSLLEANPGLKSRFPVTVNFPDYTGEELEQIAHGMLDKMKMILSPEAALRLSQVCRAQAQLNDAQSGNARFVRNLIEKACMRQAQRLVALPSRTKEQLMTLLEDDLGIPPPELGFALADKTVDILSEIERRRAWDELERGGEAAPNALQGTRDG